MKSLANAGAGVSSKRNPEDSAQFRKSNNKEIGETSENIQISESFTPRESPSSFVSFGEHICGSLFANCRQHKRPQLLETFTNPNSFLSQQTFTKKHRLQKSDAYAELFRRSKHSDKTSKREYCACCVSSEKIQMLKATEDKNAIETPDGKILLNTEIKCRESIFMRSKPQPKTAQSSLVRSHNSLTSEKSEILNSRETLLYVEGGRIIPSSGNELRHKDMIGKKRSKSDENVYYKFGLGELEKHSCPKEEVEKSRSMSDVGWISTSSEDIRPWDLNGPKRRNQTTQTGINEKGNGPGSRREESKFDPEAMTRRYYADSDCFRFALLEMKKENKEWIRKVDFLETEIMILQRELKKRDQENSMLQMEINKLRSVLEQNNVYKQKDILSSLHDSYGMSGQDQQIIAVANSSKKQGVSGESSDNGRKLNQIEIERFDKDFRSKQLIKDAILENDYLKNLDSSQVREIVDSVYPKEFKKGSYVIKEGETGSHLYVSAEGEFEVIKENKILGRMGPGRAFGELAILYNCRRTASIKVASDAKVWVLDRRVFQQIMMKTGLQRLEENVKFLQSVPLLQSLKGDVLAKIADVLEVEFYPCGEHIIRQGGSGDTFFIISSGKVKVTQHKPNRQEEEIRILSKGDYFGEQALLREDWRTANVIALSPGVECLTLDRDSFIQLIGDLSELQEKNYEDLEKRSFTKPSSNVSLSGGEEYGYIQLEDLDVISTLGVGGFGRVELVQYNSNKNMTFALKCLKKKHIVDTQQQEHVYSERNNMMACNSPFICRLYRTFRDSKYVYMLLEACLGGEVWSILRERGYFDDYTSRFVTGCVIEAFEYLHARGIIYRDLKPENLMLDNFGYIKIVDFGFSKRLAFSSKTWTFCGTPEYVAPEIILNKGHDRAVDYWSLGVLMHELLTGLPPFTGPDPMRTYNIILKGIDMIDFPKHVTRAAQSLIKRLCRDSPSERLGYQRGGIEDIKKHKWYQGFDWQGLKQRTLSPPITPLVRGPTDTSNFDSYPTEKDTTPDEFSNWDAEF